MSLSVPTLAVPFDVSTTQSPSRDLPYVATLLARMVADGAIPSDAWEALPSAEREALAHSPDAAALAEALMARRLLTQYQSGKVRAGIISGLVLGNYRLLEKIGSGGMGVVFRAEHRRLKAPAAVKALFVDGRRNRRAVDRFFREVRAVVGLRHPNIVSAIDAGEEPGAGPDGEPVPYLVMEYVAGRNLDELVIQEGPLPVARACQIAYQIADALTEAHRHGLIHRDMKPSNVIVTPGGQAKLLDFGVARLPGADHRLTGAESRLGTVGYMAPEQARDPRSVDARADVFGLAATLFYLLTGRDPFPPPGGSASAEAPPRLSAYRSEVPQELCQAISRMLSLDPAARTPTAAAVLRELSPFLGWRVEGDDPHTGDRSGETVRPAGRCAPDSTAHETALSRNPTPVHIPTPVSPKRVLIVDDEEAVRRVCRMALGAERIQCDEVTDGLSAVERATSQIYDLVLLDIDLPGLNGDQVLRRLRETPPAPHLKVIMLSGRAPGDELSRLLSVGADDFLTKPFSVVQLRSRVNAALRLKDMQDRSDQLTRQLASANADMERALTARDAELIHARGALVLALARVVGQRSTETGGHLIRLQRYSRVLGEAAAALPAFQNRLSPEFVQLVEAAAPLHDIGKVAVPDHILHKTGPLTEEERARMQTHTTIGAETLAGVAAQYPFATAFFHTAVDIARHHHERWDGTGYPDRLAGEAIPLSARLVALGDVYDALRSRRSYKGAYTHEEAVRLMVDESPGHFDPLLLEAFKGIGEDFDRIFRDMSD